MKKWQYAPETFILLLLCSTIVVFFLTAFYPANTKLSAIPVPELPDDLDNYLLESEASFSPKEGTQKEILWFHADKRVTEVSIIYLHGFSASRGEISPVAEEVAKSMKANLFFTRLKGHGLTSDDMGTAAATDWIADANEALAIARCIGKRVVIMGTSTGAALGIHLAKSNPQDIEALVFISTNFRPKFVASWMTSGPLGKFIARLLIGKYFSFVPRNEKQAYYWTYKYPSSAVSELMDLLKYIRHIDLKKIKIPILMMYTKSDLVISTCLIEKKFSLFGSVRKKLFKSESPNHVMAGDILSPQWTQPTIDEIVDFLKVEL